MTAWLACSPHSVRSGLAPSPSHGGDMHIDVWHEWNRGPHGLAASGVAIHIEDPGALILRQWDMRNFLEVYQAVRLQRQWQGEGIILLQMQRAMGLNIRSRAGRTDRLRAGQHRIANWEATQGCDRCGRTACKGMQQARLRQWRQQCIPFKTHERRLMRRHQLAQWKRRKCATAAQRLSKTMCTWRRRHPAEGRRPRGKRPPPR